MNTDESKYEKARIRGRGSAYDMWMTAVTQLRFSHRRSPGNLGFTLLEIMVALSVIALVLVSVYRLHAQTISMTRSARFYTTAPLLAQRKMADIETIPFKELTDDDGSFGENYPDYRWTVTIGEVESDTLGQTAEGLKQIEVTVSFGSDPWTYNLRTYRFYSE